MEELRRTVGEFELLREIGRGGVGVVYEALQASLGRRIALKLLPALAGNETPIVVRFRREAASAAALEHPGIIEVHGFGHSELGYWIAMDLHETGSLSQRAETLRERGIAACVTCIARVADALHHAHEHGVVHRDVKPANILLRPDLSPVLTDFGLARQLGDPGISETGGFVGTPYYSAPEQVEGGAIDARTDVFALGVTLYELLTRKRPFDGASSHEVLSRIRTHDPVDPRRHAKELPADLAAIVLKAIEKAPGDRYQSARELADDLRAFLEFKKISARRASWPQRIRRAVRREPLKALLSVAVLALVATGGYLLTNLGDLRAGERLDRQRRVEEQIVDAMGLLLFGEPEPAHAACVRALELDPSNEEAIVCAVLCKLGSAAEITNKRNASAASAELAARSKGLAATPALRRLGIEIEAYAAGSPQQSSTEPVAGPLESFVAGYFATERAMRGDRYAERIAGDLLRRATLASERPRLSTTLAFARCAHVLKQRDNIEDVAVTLRTHWSERADAQHALGIILSHYDAARSEAAYKKALELSPRWASAWHDYAALLAMQGNWAAARKAYERAVEFGPERVRSHEALANECFRLDDHAAAERHAKAALALDPLSIKATLTLCYVHLERDEADQAEGLVLPVLARRPDLAGAHAVYGAVLEQRHDDSGALTELGRALELDPNDVRPRGARASVLLRTGKLEAAIEDLRAFAKLAPKNASVHATLGVALHQIGKSEEGIRELETAIELEPDKPATRKNLIALLRDLGDFPSERQALSSWLAACPAAALPRLMFARFLLVDPAADPARDLASGLECLDRAVELEPEAAKFALLERAKLLIWAREFKAATALLTSALEPGAGNASIHGELETLLWKSARASRDARRLESRPTAPASSPRNGR